MILGISEKHNSRPLKTMGQKITVFSYIDALKDCLNCSDTLEAKKALMELERAYRIEIESRKENFVHGNLKQELDKNRAAFNQLYAKYQKETTDLQKKIQAKSGISLEVLEKEKEIKYLQEEIAKMQKCIYEAEDFREITKQCQSLETSMAEISKKCEQYHEKIKIQSHLIAKLSQKNSELLEKNGILQQQLLVSEQKSSSFLQTFEKNLRSKANDYREKTLTLLNCKSPTGSKSIDLTLETAYLSPKVRIEEEANSTPPTFKNLNKVKEISPKTLKELKLRLV